MDTEQQKKGIGLIPLAALVIGSAIGGGVFGIMTDISGSAGGPALFSWVLVGTSMMMLSLSINNINKKRPELEGGIFSYAEAGFGRFSGFISGWGYWLTCWLGNVAFATLLMSALGYFFPVFDGGKMSPRSSSVLYFCGDMLGSSIEESKMPVTSMQS